MPHERIVEQGSLQTGRGRKDACVLYGRWQTGRPAAVCLVPGVHGQDVPSLEKDCCSDCWVTAIQLSEAGPLAAWSVGWAGALVDTDVSTCRIRNSRTPSSMPVSDYRVCNICLSWTTWPVVLNIPEGLTCKLP